MITRAEVLNTWHQKWSKLHAWRTDLSSVTLNISDRRHAGRLGTCWGNERITIYRAVDAPRFNAYTELYVLLHELAHAAVIDEHHGVRWQSTHAEAVREVTGIGIPKAANNYRILVRVGRDAVKSWWHTSGNDFLLKLAGVSA